MKDAMLIFFAMFFTQPAFAANPDQGLLTRILCYGVSEEGNPESRDPNFTIVVQQKSIRKNDASYFVPGNSNYNNLLSREERFEIRIYSNANGISNSDDSRQFANDLYNSEPSFPIIEASGVRSRERIKFIWNNMLSGLSFNRVPPGQFQSSTITANENDEIGARFIYCEDAHGVSLEVPAATEQHSDESADLGSDESGTPAAL